MLNRIPTPPTPVDESIFLAVVHPYPLNANLELHADQRVLALWLACCVGKDVLRAIFYKSSSPEMVVIEVDPEFDRFHQLLGLHVWSEFLMEPNKEQMDKSSTVFYSTFNMSRLVNSGWKRVSIEEHRFQEWTTKNPYPYPKSGHCNFPSSSEAKSSTPLCRLLPQRSLTVPLPVPTSSEEGQPRHSVAASISDFDGPNFDNWNMPADAAAPAGGPSRAGGVVNLLGGYNAPSLEPPTKMKKGGWTYPQHGSHYNPGICKERTRVKRDKRTRVAREKWEEERRQREAQRPRGQVEREMKNAEAISEGESGGCSRPPRLCRNTSSGTSASSSSGSESDSGESHKQGFNTSPLPDPEGWPMLRNTGSSDTQPAEGREILAWDSDARWYDDDEDEGGASTARSHHTDMINAALHGSRTSSPASMSSSGRSKGPMLSTTPPSSACGRSSWPSLSSNSRPPTTDTERGDPIAKEDSCKTGGRERNAERDQTVSKSARKRMNKTRDARAQTQAQEQATQASLLEVVLDVELPPGGPGSLWGDPNEVW